MVGAYGGMVLGELWRTEPCLAAKCLNYRQRSSVNERVLVIWEVGSLKDSFQTLIMCTLSSKPYSIITTK